MPSVNESFSAVFSRFTSFVSAPAPFAAASPFDAGEAGRFFAPPIAVSIAPAITLSIDSSVEKGSSQTSDSDIQ